MAAARTLGAARSGNREFTAIRTSVLCPPPVIAAPVEKEWCRSGWMRARVRYRVEKSVVLMNGGCRALLSGGG